MPIEIADIYDLQDMELDLTEDYVLVDDIDGSPTDPGSPNFDSGEWNSSGFRTIGNSSTAFTGSLDGAGHVVDGLFIDRAQVACGFFGDINGATVTDFGLTNLDLTNANNNATGGLVGRVFGNHTIERCFTTGTVTHTGSVFNTGGLIGIVINNGVIRDCYSQCSVSGNSTVGGFAGRARGDTSSGLIVRCYSTGAVSGSTLVEGFATQDSSTDVMSVTNSFWDTQTSGTASNTSDATGKTTAEMQDIDTFTDTATTGLDEAWDMVLVGNYDDEIWFIDDGADYPRLGWQFEEEDEGTVVQLSPQTVTASPQAPTVRYPATVELAPQTATAAPASPVVRLPVTVELDALSVTAEPQSIEAVGHTRVRLQAQSVTAEPQAPTIRAGATVQLAPQSVEAAPGAPLVGAGVAVILAAQSVTAQPQAPRLVIPAVAQLAPVVVTAETLAPKLIIPSFTTLPALVVIATSVAPEVAIVLPIRRIGVGVLNTKAETTAVLQSKQATATLKTKRNEGVLRSKNI